MVKRDNVDVLIGTVHSGVQMAIHKVGDRDRHALIVPNAGDVAVTRDLCAKNVFRTSFSNWQPAYGMGVALGKKRLKKACWMTWDYAAGAESGAGFKEGFEKAGGQVLQVLTLQFPQTNFQPLLAQIPGLGVDVVGSFFAGGGAVKFVKEYAAAGLKVPLCGSGFLTEGTLEAQGAAAEGIETALHYGDGLDNPKNTGFRGPSRTRPAATPTSTPCRATTPRSCSAIGPRGREGQPRGRGQRCYKAMRAAKIDSPARPDQLLAIAEGGAEHLSAQGEGGLNKVIGVAVENLADPGTGCKLALTLAALRTSRKRRYDSCDVMHRPDAA